jgi:hypothetical protein
LEPLIQLLWGLVLLLQQGVMLLEQMVAIPFFLQSHPQAVAVVQV